MSWLVKKASLAGEVARRLLNTSPCLVARGEADHHLDKLCYKMMISGYNQKVVFRPKLPPTEITLSCKYIELEKLCPLTWIIMLFQDACFQSIILIMFFKEMMRGALTGTESIMDRQEWNPMASSTPTGIRWTCFKFKLFKIFFY